MLTVSKDYNPVFKELRLAIKTEDINRVHEQALYVHALAHDKRLTNLHQHTFQDQCLQGLNNISFRHTVSKKYQGYRTLAFFIFHMTRIEDICANTLIANQSQVIFNDNWLEKLNINRVDTGNSMTQDEMEDFSANIIQEELFAYRFAVGKQTQNVIKNLSVTDLKQRPSQEQLNFIFSSKSVLKHKDSAWLVDYWGKKNIGELLLMPITLHELVHLNDCLAIIKATK
ncbi:hypothetical protein SAMN04488134_103250 [Amphibacillus marinus]|uniref:DinB superfamily protein n=1 Tax=Amphibacillus marinus TaxID=872970 RepID=A0A1H8LMB7_9BACI|nr:hypothetical protein [Amphibacillus marinus]SEO05928.1 hypothetical protein SAMN04488134_103250 [Amphibacillus marinus]